MLVRHRPGFSLMLTFPGGINPVDRYLAFTIGKDGVIGKMGIMGHCVDGVAGDNVR